MRLPFRSLRHFFFIDIRYAHCALSDGTRKIIFEQWMVDWLIDWLVGWLVGGLWSFFFSSRLMVLKHWLAWSSYVDTDCLLRDDVEHAPPVHRTTAAVETTGSSSATTLGTRKQSWLTADFVVGIKFGNLNTCGTYKTRRYIYLVWTKRALNACYQVRLTLWPR